MFQLKNPFYFYSMDDELKEKLHNILQACRVHRPLPYLLTLPPWKVVKISKIAEGSYGEIYLVKNTDGSERILKIIGVYGSPRDDPSRSLDFEDAVGDVICTKSLSKLVEPGVFQAPNFPKAFSIDLVKGKAPKCLVDAWQRFRDNPNTEETYHFRPDRYTPESLFLIMELENCGDNFLSTVAIPVCSPTKEEEKIDELKFVRIKCGNEILKAVIDTRTQISVVRADVVEGQIIDSGGTIQIMSAFGERGIIELKIFNLKIDDSRHG
ncbi:hypothetical protein TNIN_220451 [Trichonephila inaurata madagascariensis]|uniref:Uncharacterized protein n=1 Tax=Trichonephila inaurata madagascariensis TaxID=2747483 RepID=A0A8X6Y8U5_9ARAC|nr:hypothetical protein TNIN_220451 [Trichonephila inaurata madagascariensis]